MGNGLISERREHEGAAFAQIWWTWAVNLFMAPSYWSETGDVPSKFILFPSQTHVKGRITQKINFKDAQNNFFIFFLQINYHLLTLGDGRVDGFNFSKSTAEVTLHALAALASWLPSLFMSDSGAILDFFLH